MSGKRRRMPRDGGSKEFYVYTRDWELHKWTPQIGVPVGPYTQFGLRKALRQLQNLGYDTTRESGVSVLVERIDKEAYIEHRSDD